MAAVHLVMGYVALADFQLDHECLMAAILHDVIEDTEIEKENLKRSSLTKRYSIDITLFYKLYVFKIDFNIHTLT